MFFNLCSINTVVILQFISSISSQTFPESVSKFRILAPQFMCPKDENATDEIPDTTVITLQLTSNTELCIEWTVRWIPLVAPTQRFSIMLWRTVRALEKQLNALQPEPYVYIIENDKLLRGVNYVFNVIAVEGGTRDEQPETFNIDNTQGDHKLMVEGRNDMLSIFLVGAQIAHADIAFVIEAQVTTCFATQDFYFSWTVMNVDSELNLKISEVQSSRLEIPPLSLKAGYMYNVTCKVIRYSNGDHLSQTNLPFIVSHRGLNIYLNVDYIIVPANNTFSIESIVISHDYYAVPSIYKWKILYDDQDYNFADNSISENETLTFLYGLPLLGEYKVLLSNFVPNNLPILQVVPVQKIINEGSEVSLVVNASNVTPTCTLSWYFTSEVDAINNESHNSSFPCEDCQHGEPLSETLTVYSLEEQILSEPTNFTNETEWRHVTTVLVAKAGRARFVAQCGCSLTFNCDTLGMVYADVWFQVNESPKADDVMISPDAGVALETIFRISTLAVTDPDTPLKYTFYCKVGEEKVLLASYFEHRAVETLLPYADDGIDLWIEVCDALGACSNGNRKRNNVSPGKGRTVDALIADINAYARRCEIHLLHRIAVFAIVTYNNQKQVEPLSKFSEALQRSLSALDTNCIAEHFNEYSDLSSSLERIDVIEN